MCVVSVCLAELLCAETLRQVSRCAELVKRSAVMLSLASSSAPTTTITTTMTPMTTTTPRRTQDTNQHRVAATDSPRDTQSADPQPRVSNSQSLGTLSPALASLLAGAGAPCDSSSRDSSPASVLQQVQQAVDDLCQLIQLSVSDHSLTASASASSHRRMLPIVPGTSVLSPPGATHLPGSVVGRSGVRCQSARSSADGNHLSRHISAMRCPGPVLRQLSNDL